MLTAALIALALTPAPAATRSVCADYPNQAAAQKAADTIDADHDGIFCETLPCPCLKPGAPAPAHGPTAAAPVTAIVGASRALHPVTKARGCRVLGGLP